MRSITPPFLSFLLVSESPNATHVSRNKEENGQRDENKKRKDHCAQVVQEIGVGGQ